jgi:hypothetical protein
LLKIFKLLLGLACLAGFIWCGANIPLGPRTLFEHLQAIGRTRETQELLDGTRETARPLVDGVRRRMAKSEEKSDERSPAAPDGGVRIAAPSEEITEQDRKRLRKLLNSEKTAIR